MAKKRDKQKKKDDADPALPKFGGFHPLAGGLEGFKAKLDAEKKAAPAPSRAAPAPSPAPSPARKPEPPRSTSSGRSDLDDEMSFHHMMSGVTPLDATAKARVPLTSEVRPGEQRMKAAEVRA